MSLAVSQRTSACALLLVAGTAVVSLSIVALPAAAIAQGYGAPVSYGKPYTPPWHAGARRPLDNSYRAPPPPVPASRPAWRPPAAIWQGLYIGAHGGAASGRITDRDFDETVKMSGGVLGLHGGYNAQIGNWVLGLEGDGTWAGVEGDRHVGGGAAVDGRVDWTSSLRLRAGYAFDNVLLYVTGGAAFAGIEVGISDGLGSARVSDTLLGWAIGGGIEMKLAPSVSGRLEAIHYGFNDKSIELRGGSVPIDAGSTTVRAGLTFHLN